LLRYLSEIRFQVLTAIYPRFTHESGTIRKKQAIDVSKLKRLLCHESQHQSQSNEKSLVRFDYEKAVSNYLGTQSTFKQQPVRRVRTYKTTPSRSTQSASKTGVVRTQERACSYGSRFRCKLSGTTGHRLLGTQRPQMLCVAAWVWFCLTTEFVGRGSHWHGTIIKKG